MYIYNIGYDTYEESSFTQFSFDKKLNKEELRNYVNQATINALNYAIANPNELCAGLENRGPSFADLYPKITKELVKMGFKPLEFAEEWTGFGWASVCIEDWKEGGLEMKLLREAIPKELREKAIEICDQKLKALIDSFKKK